MCDSGGLGSLGPEGIVTAGIVESIRETITAVDPAWESADLETPQWGLALHAHEFDHCSVCGSWGTLIPDDCCRHPIVHRDLTSTLAITTLGGEVLPLMPELCTALFPAGLWLMGAVPVTVRALPIQQPRTPMVVAELILSVAARLTATDLEAVRVYARLSVDLARKPLVLLASERPATLPL